MCSSARITVLAETFWVISYVYSVYKVKFLFYSLLFLRLVTKMSNSGENHSHIELITEFDNLRIANRTTWLDNRCYA